MDEWERILAELESARAAHQGYRQAVAARHAAANLTPQERLDAAARGDLHLALEGDAADRHLANLRATAESAIGSHAASAQSIRDGIARRDQEHADAEAPTGAEAIARRVEMEGAAARIRGMLDRGTKPEAIAARAVSLGDRLALAALRSEIEWRTVHNPDLSEVVAGFEDQGAPQELIRRIDEMELPILPTAARRAREAELRARAEWPAVKLHLAQLGDKLDGGRGLEDAIALRLAGPS